MRILSTITLLLALVLLAATTQADIFSPEDEVGYSSTLRDYTLDGRIEIVSNEPEFTDNEIATYTPIPGAFWLLGAGLLGLLGVHRVHNNLG